MIADTRRQAKSFAAINGSTFKMTSMAVFKAALAAGEPEPVRCAAIAESCGVRILTYPSQARRQREGDTMAASSLLRALADHGEDALRLALTAIMASRGSKCGLVDSANVRALARLFREHPMKPETVKAAFARIDLRAARAEARRDGFQSLALDMKAAVAKRLLALAKAGARAPALPAPAAEGRAA
ncbi:hypothetical protein [Roseiarcus fermentans]|uniref:hypothetical protein n=1 Tax=Roseiarcus fermentans TaxID=1473586 RepID=UPI0011BF0CA3|nr:hypothetical protein [Roseiarcus fermentans]